MGKIRRYCVTDEEHEGDNVFRVHRGYILGNPYTHIKGKDTKATVVVKSREEAIERYKRYFERCLAEFPEFRDEFERMVDACMKYDDIWIGCYCKEGDACHADYIIKRLRQECTRRMIAGMTRKKDE